MDFAAWIEVYLDGTWYTFDPRNNPARKGRVLIGRGRDALDVAMVTTFGGPVLEQMEVWAEEVPERRAGRARRAGRPDGAARPGDARDGLAGPAAAAARRGRPGRTRAGAPTCCTSASATSYDGPAYDVRPAAGRGAPGAARAAAPPGAARGRTVSVPGARCTTRADPTATSSSGSAAGGARSRWSSRSPPWWSAVGPAGRRAAAGGRADRPRHLRPTRLTSRTRHCGRWPRAAGRAHRTMPASRRAACRGCGRSWTSTSRRPRCRRRRPRRTRPGAGSARTSRTSCSPSAGLAGVPARYVSGHLLGEQGGSHAWVEVLVADGRNPGRARAVAVRPDATAAAPPPGTCRSPSAGTTPTWRPPRASTPAPPAAG